MAGSQESVAAGGVTALLVFPSANNTIAADLVSGINANTGASLSLVSSSSAWEVSVRGARWFLIRERSSLLATGEVQGLVVSSTGTVQVNFTWAGNVQRLKSVDGTTLETAWVINVSSVAAAVSGLVVAATNSWVQLCEVNVFCCVAAAWFGSWTISVVVHAWAERLMVGNPFVCWVAAL